MNSDYEAAYHSNETLTESSFKNCFDNILKHTSLSQLEDVKKIKEWYEYKDKDTKEKVLRVVDVIGNELTQIVTIPYLESLIKKLEFKTEKREISLKDTEIGLFDTDIHPYVEFRHLLNGQSIHSIKFKFHINIITNIKKLTAKLIDNHPVFFIERLKIELKITLIGIETDILDKSIPINPLLKPIDLGKGKMEIDHLELFTKKSNTRNSEQSELQQELIKSTDKIECSKCYGQIPYRSIFCNQCGSKVDTSSLLISSNNKTITSDIPMKRSPL